MGVILAALAVELMLMGLVGLGIVAKPAEKGSAPVPNQSRALAPTGTAPAAGPVGVNPAG
jgi:hypothetical protein